MKFYFFYFIGCVFVFCGLLWSFMPHVYHEQVFHSIDEDSIELPHIIHILQGVIPVIIGLIIMVYSNKKITKTFGFVPTHKCVGLFWFW